LKNFFVDRNGRMVAYATKHIHTAVVDEDFLIFATTLRDQNPLQPQAERNASFLSFGKKRGSVQVAM
jgi:hypothetical protein